LILTYPGNAIAFAAGCIGVTIIIFGADHPPKAFIVI
jgi:hypothetical protein